MMKQVPAKSLIETANHYQRLFDTAQDGMLILDFKTGRIEDANPYILGMTGYSKSEILGKQLWEIGAFADKGAALAAFKVLSDSGYIRYKSLPLIAKSGDVLQVEFVSNVYDLDHHRIIQCQIRDISKEEEKNRLLSVYKDSVTQGLKEMATTFSLLIEQRDPYTAGHQHRVAKLAVAIGRELNLDAHTIEGLEFSASIHDIGKMGIPSEILTKPDALNSLEIAMLRNHAQAGFNVIKHINLPWPVAQTVLQHHERMDGSGYPNQTRSSDIIFEARILAVADTVEAMCGRRPYRVAPGLTAALETIKRASGVLYDAQVVDACVKVFENGFSFNGSAPHSAEMRDIDHL